jgi:hypothetical protein
MPKRIKITRQSILQRRHGTHGTTRRVEIEIHLLAGIDERAAVAEHLQWAIEAICSDNPPGANSSAEKRSDEPA